MRLILFFLLTVFLLSVNAQAALYEWKDDKGVINFTDNLDSVPAKYKKRVKKRPSITVEDSESASPKQDDMESPKVAEPAPTSESQASYGGHNEDWWRSRFNSLRGELKTIQDGLPAKNEELGEARRKMNIYSYPRYRKAYYDLMADIEKDNSRIKELNTQLESLDNEASRAGVPFDWRQ
jgi:hypothetical protein